MLHTILHSPLLLLAAAGIVVVVTISVLEWKDMIETALEARRTRKQAREAALQSLANVNNEVAEAITALTQLGRQQLLGEAPPDAPQQVQASFGHLNALIAAIPNDEHRTWLQAVVDRYRHDVRVIMRHGHEATEDPHVLAEFLKDSAGTAIGRLRFRTNHKGQPQYMVPLGPDGEPFKLEA